MESATPYSVERTRCLIKTYEEVTDDVTRTNPHSICPRSRREDGVGSVLVEISDYWIFTPCCLLNTEVSLAHVRVLGYLGGPGRMRL